MVSKTHLIVSIVLDNYFVLFFKIAMLIMLNRLALTVGVGPSPASEVDQQNAEERGAG